MSNQKAGAMGGTEEVRAIDEAWAELEKSIHGLGQLVRDATPADNGRQRYEGYKAALALIVDNYTQSVHADRRRPEYLPYLGHTSNYAAPAPDFNYAMTHLEANARYRVWGTRGDSSSIEVQQHAGWFGISTDMSGLRPLIAQTFESMGITCDSQGRFEFILSPEMPAGDAQWWKLEPKASTLLFRDVFTDYATQHEAAVFHFERLDPQPDHGSWSCEDSVRRIQALGRSMQQYGFCFKLGLSFAKIGDNKFRTENFDAEAGRAGQTWYQIRFSLKPGQALAGEWRVPNNDNYWSMTLYTDQYQALNFAEHQASLNFHQAHIGDDQICRFVICDGDPGVANWLDTDGHRTGLMLLRVANVPDAAEPSAKLVDKSDLTNSFSGEIRRISEQERQQVLTLRRRNFKSRMRR